MKTIKILFLSFFFTVKIFGQTENFTNFELRTIDSIQFYQSKTAYQNHINHDTNLIKLTTEEIKLPMKKGTRDLPRTYQGETEPYYEYIGFIPEVSCYVIRELHYEGSWVYLVDSVYGYLRFHMTNEPRISPNMNYVANLSEEFGMESVPIGVQIRKIEKENDGSLDYRPALVEIYQFFWVPEELVWKNNSTIQIKAIEMNYYDGIQEKSTNLMVPYIYLEIEMK